MKTTIVSITEANLEQVAAAGAKFGMPRSAGWLRRCLFDPTVEDLTTDKIRGHMSVDENGDVKAVHCYYYQPCYLLQTKILVETGAIMGSEAKYGEELLAVMDKNMETQSRGVLTIGNCIYGRRPYTINKKVFLMKEPPYRAGGQYRVCVINPCVLIISAIGRIRIQLGSFKRSLASSLHPRRKRMSRHIPRQGMSHKEAGSVVRRGRIACAGFLKRLLANVLSPFSKPALRSMRRRIGISGFIMREHGSFGDYRFKDFWERFLAANDGVISSREPTRLKWLFDESIKAGKVFLAAAEKEGRIEGYVLIRECGVGGPPPKSYEIIDICAVGNNARCLEALACEAALVAEAHGGVQILFSGSMQNQEEWLDPVFRHCAWGQCYFMYSSGNGEINAALNANKGWFFGPLDGERCMGHGGYIDL